mmetsp:Transcript_24526/g.29931  ORF Transcript_24526/g.29931 Transcript_24526/m.29931 type:complete len:591 (+) Transcript_24526:66-1838(+)
MGNSCTTKQQDRLEINTTKKCGIGKDKYDISSSDDDPNEFVDNTNNINENKNNISCDNIIISKSSINHEISTNSEQSINMSDIMHTINPSMTLGSLTQSLIVPVTPVDTQKNGINHLRKNSIDEFMLNKTNVQHQILQEYVKKVEMLTDVKSVLQNEINELKQKQSNYERDNTQGTLKYHETINKFNDDLIKKEKNIELLRQSIKKNNETVNLLKINLSKKDELLKIKNVKLRETMKNHDQLYIANQKYKRDLKNAKTTQIKYKQLQHSYESKQNDIFKLHKKLEELKKMNNDLNTKLVRKDEAINELKHKMDSIAQQPNDHKTDEKVVNESDTDNDSNTDNDSDTDDDNDDESGTSASDMNSITTKRSINVKSVVESEESSSESSDDNDSDTDDDDPRKYKAVFDSQYKTSHMKISKKGRKIKYAGVARLKNEIIQGNVVNIRWKVFNHECSEHYFYGISSNRTPLKNFEEILNWKFANSFYDAIKDITGIFATKNGVIIKGKIVKLMHLKFTKPEVPIKQISYISMEVDYQNEDYMLLTFKINNKPIYINNSDKMYTIKLDLTKKDKKKQWYPTVKLNDYDDEFIKAY